VAILTNYIVPSDVDAVGEPLIHDEFVFCVYNICFSLKYDFWITKFIVYSDSSLYIYHHENAKQYVVKSGLGIKGDWYTVSNGKLIPFNDKSFMESTVTTKCDTCNVIRMGRGEYDFINKKTGKRIHFKQKHNVFLTERDGNIYFLSLKSHDQLICTDINFNELKDYKYVGIDVGTGKCLDQYLFHELKTKPCALEVFDLDKFKPVARYEGIEKRGILQVFYQSEVYHIFYAGCLFLWDGTQLAKHPFEQRIANYLVKEEFIYIGFDNDANLYAYKPVSLELIHQQKICLKNFQVLSFSTSGVHNTCSLRPFDTTFGQYYFICWSDDEFFGDPWEIVEESPIYNEVQVEEGNLFFLRINIDASHDYLTIARQSLAIIDDAIVRHSASTIPSDAGKPYSEAFNGVVEACYNNSRHLANEYREQLTETCKKIEEFYWVARGYAKGDPQPIRVNVLFND
jgi:hypothetical protein